MLMYYLTSLSMILWLFPLFKQYNTQYRYSFILFAFTNPISFILNYFVVLPFSYYNIFAQLLLIATFLKKPNKRYLIFGYSTLAIVYLLVFRSSEAKFGFSVLNGLVIIFILLEQVFDNLKDGKINLFLVILVSFFLLSTLRSMGMSFRTNLGIISANLGYVFQMIYAILFTFINLDTKTYRIKPITDSSINV